MSIFPSPIVQAASTDGKLMPTHLLHMQKTTKPAIPALVFILLG
jgi:hypothetical protein